MEDDNIKYYANYDESTSSSYTCTWNEYVVIIWLRIMLLAVIYTHYLPGVTNITYSYVMNVFLPIDWHNKNDGGFYFVRTWRLQNENPRLTYIVIYNRIER